MDGSFFSQRPGGGGGASRTLLRATAGGSPCAAYLVSAGSETLGSTPSRRRILAMNAKHVTPILNVSDMAASFAWFAKWGWRKCRDWGTPATFGAVGSGEVEIFLCQGARADGAKERIRLRFRKMETKRATRVRGCRCGWTTRMRFTGNALALGWMSLFRRQTCRGMSARCTYDTRMGTCFESAKGSRRRNSGERKAKSKSEKQVPRLRSG